MDSRDPGHALVGLSWLASTRITFKVENLAEPVLPVTNGASAPLEPHWHPW